MQFSLGFLCTGTNTHKRCVFLSLSVFPTSGPSLHLQLPLQWSTLTRPKAFTVCHRVNWNQQILTVSWKLLCLNSKTFFVFLYLMQIWPRSKTLQLSTVWSSATTAGQGKSLRVWLTPKSIEYVSNQCWRAAWLNNCPRIQASQALSYLS